MTSRVTHSTDIHALEETDYIRILAYSIRDRIFDQAKLIEYTPDGLKLLTTRYSEAIRPTLGEANLIWPWPSIDDPIFDELPPSLKFIKLQNALSDFRLLDAFCRRLSKSTHSYGSNNFSYGSRPLVLHPSPVLEHGIDMATQEPSRSSMFMENIYSPAAREDAYYIFTDVGIMGEDDLRDNIHTNAIATARGKVDADNEIEVSVTNSTVTIEPGPSPPEGDTNIGILKGIYHHRRKYKCPITNCSRNDKEKRKLFKRSDNLCNHLRTVHNLLIPQRSRVMKWIGENRLLLQEVERKTEAVNNTVREELGGSEIEEDGNDME